MAVFNVIQFELRGGQRHLALPEFIRVRSQNTGDRIQNKVLAFGSVKRILFRYDGVWLFSRRLNKNTGAKRHRILLSPVFCILISLVHSFL